jgi:hypothetical protein
MSLDLVKRNKEPTVTAIAYALSRAVEAASENEGLKLIAILCGIGLFVSLTLLTYGLDLSPGFF